MQRHYSSRQFSQKPIVTYGIIGITLVTFGLQVFFGGSENIESLIIMGAKFNELIIYNNEWWRLITPIFLHIGVPHLLFNMLVVYFLGQQIEFIFGHVRFTLLYLFSGLMGNAFSFAFNTSLSAGASTAIFGLFVSTIVLSKLFPHVRELGMLARQYGMLIFLNIVFSFMSGGVDNMGHIGGLVGGYLISYAISVKHTDHNPLHNRFTNIGIYCIILGILIFIGYNQLLYINF